MRIVIVEDEAPIREGMEGILKKLNPSYELAGKAADGIEGLEVIRRVKPDLIIMDIRMPDMDGPVSYTHLYLIQLGGYCMEKIMKGDFFIE